MTGPGFESQHLHLEVTGKVAQSAEHGIEAPGVEGSIPSLTTARMV